MLREGDGTLVSYSVVHGEILVLAVNQDQTRLRFLDAEALPRLVNRQVKLFRDPLLGQRTKRDEFLQNAHELHRILLGPVEDLLTGEQLVVLPQGRLFQLPFETLLTEAYTGPFTEAPFLLRDRTVSYHYTGTTFQYYQQKPAITDRSLLAFAPVFDQGENSTPAAAGRTRSLDFLPQNDYEAIVDDRFRPLPETEREVSAITKLVEAPATTTLLLRDAATEPELRAALEARPYRFVHLATHGLAQSENPSLSGLACHPTGETQEALLFAGNVERLRLDTDLVVLSSCESGVGRVLASEGVLALNRSFTYAGARNVLYSLWKVDDATTRDLMVAFYGEVLNQQADYAPALRSVKLSLLKNTATASPRSWAAFVLMGQ